MKKCIEGKEHDFRRGGYVGAIEEEDPIHQLKCIHCGEIAYG